MHSYDDEHANYVREYMPAEDFFGADPQADFYYWGKLSYWTIEEATALSYGFEPRIVSLEYKDQGHPFVMEYRRRLEALRRAVVVDELPERLPPTKYIAWTAQMGFPFSPELAQIVQGPKQSQSGSGLDETPLNPKERQSYQKLCLGLVRSKYQYKPDLSRNPAHKKIMQDIAKEGINLDEDTVRKCLQAASDEFGHLLKE